MRILLRVFNRVGHGTYWRAFHMGRVLVARRHQVTFMAVSLSAFLRFREWEEAGLHILETPEVYLPGGGMAGICGTWCVG